MMQKYINGEYNPIEIINHLRNGFLRLTLNNILIAINNRCVRCRVELFVNIKGLSLHLIILSQNRLKSGAIFPKF